MKKNISTQTGFSLLEILISILLATLFSFLMFQNLDSLNSKVSLTRTVSSRDRVLAGIRSIAGMPAALRNSMRAQGTNGPTNPELLSCVGGNENFSGPCLNGDPSVAGTTNIPFTLYSPVLALDINGNPMGITAISAPLGSNLQMRFDTFGSPCTTATADCPLLVYTSFTPQCGLPVQPSTSMVPQPQCTFAELIEVTYYVQLDPNLKSAYPELNAFLQTVTGSIVTSVKQISGNNPY